MKASSDKRAKRESGAISLISIFVMTIMLMLTAFVIDYGFYNYKSTKLQNATDAAATAVAANLDATDASLDQIARSYLTKNGFDGASNDVSISIEKKNVAPEGSINDDEYITAGYLKVTVEMKQGLMFAGFFNTDAMHLKRTSYVKCDIDYIEMPRALKYTLFAGSTGAGTNGGATMQINGRTGNVTNFINSVMEGFINGVNEAIVQPIIGIFGGNPKYTDLVHMNLSEAVTDGDVHSNGTISIGIQALNASRTKDGNLTNIKTDSSGNPVTVKDEEGNTVYKEVEQVKVDSNGNPIHKLDSFGNYEYDVDGNYVYETETVSTPVYVYEADDSVTNSNDFDDYGQVTYTSVGNINFNNTSLDNSTRVYTQNQQYLEITQAALNILNSIDYTKVANLDQLKVQYTNQANIYLTSKGDKISANQGQEILNQKNNLGYNASTKTITLNNQTMIVYESTQRTTNTMINEVSVQDKPSTYLYNELNKNGNDPAYNPSNKNPYYNNVADTGSSLNYEVKLSPSDSNGNPIEGVTVQVKGGSVARDFAKTNVSSTATNNYTATGLKFAVNSTFIANLGPEGYIPTPNMKPYFVREINRSIRNATQNQSELTSTQYNGQLSIKQSVAAMTNDLIDILKATEYVDNTYTTTNSDGKTVLNSKANSLLFQYYKPNADSGLTEAESDTSKTINGFNIFKSEGVLYTPEELISQRASATILNDAGQNAVNNFYNSNVKNNDGTSYATNFGADAVERKKDSLSTSFASGYSDKQQAISAANMTTFDDVVGSHEDVFLGPENSVITKKLKSELSFASGISYDTTNYNSLTLTYNDVDQTGAKWPDGTTGTKSLNKSTTNSGSGDIGGNFFTGNYTNSTGGGLFGGGNSTSVGSGKIAVVKGDLTVSNKNLDVGTDGGKNTVLVVTGNISVPKGDLQVRSGCTLYCLGNISCNIATVETGAQVYCGGNFTMSMSSAYFTNNGKMCIGGNFTMSGDKDYVTLKNYGQIYVGGNFQSTFKTYHENSEMYVLGQFINTTNNSNSSSDDFIEAKGTSKIYIGNGVSVDVARRRAIWIHDGSNSIVSIYSTSALTDYDILSGVNVVENSTTGGKTYIGVSNPAKSVYHATSLEFKINDSSMYAYCGFNLTNASISCSGAGTTFIQGTLYAPNTDINVSNGHTFIVAKKAVTSQSDDNKVTLKSLNVSGTNTAKSRAWILGNLICPNLSVDSSNASYISEIFCGESSKLGNGGNTSLNINGYLFIPSISYFPLGNLSVGKFGSYIYNGNTIINGSLTIEQGATDSTGILFIKGSTKVTGAITNNGKMYLYGGLDLASSTAGNGRDITFGSNSDTFIGSNIAGGVGNLTFKGYYNGNGNVYIENNLTINGYNQGKHIDNRDEAIFQQSGSTYISGDVNVTSKDNGIYTSPNTIFSCKTLTVHSAIYNEGKMYLLGNLDFKNDGKFSDSNDSSGRAGFSIRNGGKNGNIGAVFYIGGSSTFTIGGSFQNWGKFISNGGMTVQGWHSGSYGDCAILNENGSVAHFGSASTAADTSFININTNSNTIYNGVNSVFTTRGGVDYGQTILNVGKFAALGDVYQKQNGTVNTKKYRDSQSFSLANGTYSYDWNPTLYPNSVFYCGGSVTLGTTLDAGEAGSVMNVGKMYVVGNLYDYTRSNSSVVASGNDLYNIAIYTLEDTDLIVGGNVFGGGAVVTGNNSIVMAGGDFISARSLKLNLNFGTTGQVVGETNWLYYNFRNTDHKDYVCDTYSPCYFYVGGNCIANKNGKNLFNNGGFPTDATRDFVVYSNTNIYVGGEMYVNSKCYIKQNVTMIVAGNKQMKETVDGSSNTYSNNGYALYVKQCFDENICSRMVVNGAMYVSDTCKIRDMSKNWVYGDFKCNSYVEVGKSLNDDNADESQATTDTYKAPGENKKNYVFSNAGQLNVAGDFQSLRYTKVYASTLLRVGGDFVSYNYLTLRHDAKMYVGKKLLATQSIDGGSYCEFHIAGSMQSVLSTIKIRDAATCVVGGNMTALSYVELGKAGDYTRQINSNGDGTYIVNETDAHGIHVSEGKEDSYNTDSNDQENNKTGDGDGAGIEGVAGEETVIDTATIDAMEELARDESDTALGSEFYVGKVLASYTSYIKEFSYSRVVVGEYVFTPKYLTLRHNADMWVMPETFNNTTYVYKSYVPQSDGTFWGNLVDRIREFNYNVSQFFMPKAGSIYCLGELTLNKNASLMGSYDCVVQGQCLLRPDALVYMGHNFNLTAPQFNVGLSQITGWITGKETSVWGFDTYGMASATYELVCPHKEDHFGKSEGKWYKSIMLADKYDPNQTYKCQLCGRDIEKKYITAKQQTYPVVVYADNDVNILTTTDMKLTYVIANMGNINLNDVYSNSDNTVTNKTMLPNAMASFHGDINYFAIYGKIASLFYCPQGNLDLDGFYMEIWGSGIGSTVNINTYYLALHRFSNWRSMNLQVASSGNVYLVSKEEYDLQEDNSEQIFGSDPIPEDSQGGASLFFDMNRDENLDGGWD